MSVPIIGFIPHDWERHEHGEFGRCKELDQNRLDDVCGTDQKKLYTFL